jgi:hypothetical protein
MNSLYHIDAVFWKYPNTGWTQKGRTYAGLQAIKDDGTGQAIPDSVNMITEEEYNEAIAEFEVFDGWVKVRKQRNQLLKDSDYIMVLDAPIDETQKQEWTTYRQVLRDIPQDYDSPDEVVYPDKPE